MKKTLIFCFIGSAFASSTNTLSMVRAKHCKIYTPRIQPRRTYMGGAELGNPEIISELKKQRLLIEQQNNLLLDHNKYLQYNNGLLRLLIDQNKINPDKSIEEVTACAKADFNDTCEDPHHMSYYSNK